MDPSGIRNINILREVFCRLDTSATNQISVDSLKSWIKGGEAGAEVGSMFYLPPHLRECALEDDFKTSILARLKHITDKLEWSELFSAAGGVDQAEGTHQPPTRVSLSWLQELFWRLDCTGNGLSIARDDAIQVLQGKKLVDTKLPPQLQDASSVDGVAQYSETISASTDSSLSWVEMVEAFVHSLETPESPYKADSSDDEAAEPTLIRPIGPFLNAASTSFAPRAGTRSQRNMMSNELIEYLKMSGLSAEEQQRLCRTGCIYIEDLKMLTKEQLNALEIPSSFYQSVRNWCSLDKAKLNLPRQVPMYKSARAGFVPVAAELSSTRSRPPVPVPDSLTAGRVVSTDVHAWSRDQNQDPGHTANFVIADEQVYECGIGMTTSETPPTKSSAEISASLLEAAVERGVQRLSVKSKTLHEEMTQELFKNVHDRVGGMVQICKDSNKGTLDASGLEDDWSSVG